MQPLYTTLKVNNEIELCEVSDPDCKQLIERVLLKIGFPIIFVGRSPLFLTGKRIPVLSVSTIMSGTQLKRSYVGSVTSPDIMSALF